MVVDFSGKVRLVGETGYTGRGRIEAYCNGNWGLICNDGFTSEDADTVCRQLGFTVATSRGSNFGYVSVNQYNGDTCIIDSSETFE